MVLPLPNDQKSKKPISRWWVVPVVLIGTLVGWLVSRLGPVAMAEAAGVSAGMFTLMVRVFWENLGERRLRRAMAAMALAHVAFVFLFPWPRNHEISKADLLFIWVDLLPYLGMEFILDRLKRRATESIVS